MKEEKNNKTSSKIKTLKNQYNKILVDLFKQYSEDCIECALEDSKGAFGENIKSVIQCALDNLKCRIFKELEIQDIEDSNDIVNNKVDGFIIGSGMEDTIEIDVDGEAIEDQDQDQDEDEDEDIKGDEE